MAIDFTGLSVRQIGAEIDAIVVHERRVFEQARRVTLTLGFPWPTVSRAYHRDERPWHAQASSTTRR